MKKFTLIAIAGLGLFAGCKHDREPNKIIDGLPLQVEETVLPAYAVQEWILLTRDGIASAMTVLNKTTLTSPTYPEVTNISSNTYQFTRTSDRYGTATCTLQFYDSSDVAVDPIDHQLSSSTIKSLVLNMSGGSGALYTYATSTRLTLNTAGDVSDTITSTGSYAFTGQNAAAGIAMTFVQASPGSRTAFEGFKDGGITVTGSDSEGAITMSLTMSSEHSISGSMIWDGQSGGVTLHNNGTGFVVTDHSRIPIE